MTPFVEIAKSESVSVNVSAFFTPLHNFTANRVSTVITINTDE